MATTYENYGSIYGNTKSKMAEIETALAEGGFAVAYNDDEQSGMIIKPTVYEDTNNLIAGETAPEAVAEPVVAEEPVLVTDDSSDDTSTETSNE